MCGPSREMVEYFLRGTFPIRKCSLSMAELGTQNLLDTFLSPPLEAKALHYPLRGPWGPKPEASMGLTDQLAMSASPMPTSGGKGNSSFW